MGFNSAFKGLMLNVVHIRTTGLIMVKCDDLEWHKKFRLVQFLEFFEHMVLRTEKTFHNLQGVLLIP